MKDELAIYNGRGERERDGGPNYNMKDGTTHLIKK